MSNVPAPRPATEQQRLEALRALDLLDTPPEERFDRITRLTRRVFEMPVAYVALLDANRQWFKSRIGMPATETPRDESFCTYTIMGDEVLVIPDALLDERFAANPLVTGPPHVRFYAGHPLTCLDGHNVGTLCVMARRPRPFDSEDRVQLRDLAELAEREIRLADAIRLQRELSIAKQRNDELQSEICRMRIEIDHAKRDREVDAITESEYFRRLLSRAAELRD